MLAGLYNVPQGQRDWTDFSFWNADHHLQVSRTILRSSGVRVFSPPIDPIATFDIKNWLRRHQEMHNEINAALGLSGFDLSDFNPNDPKDLQSFIFNHAEEHLLWAKKTGAF